ncbi:MAG: RluA family pseudouridine synthase, partial [Chitinophagaceae bacterium]|nr:RluA family pseudouridine synthase [Chitinophagaceae bacterium]
HPGHGNRSGTLVNAIAHHLLKTTPDKELMPRVGLVHRIDKDTSGLLVIGKTEKALMSLSEQFMNHTVQREYQALVWGDILDDEGTIRSFIGRHERFRKLFTVYQEDDEKGKYAVTHYKVLERMNYVTLIECRLETGRTHQIRVHMKHIGHTLFNDLMYGGDRILKGTIYNKYKAFVDNCFDLCPRQALHAKTLGFVHPTTGEKILFESALPDDMHQLIEKWRAYCKTKRMI